MEVAGLGSTYRIGCNAVPKGRTNDYFLLLFKLSEATRNYEGIRSAGSVARVVLKSSDRKYKGYLSVNRILNSFAQEGIVQLEYKKIIILDKSKLVEIFNALGYFLD